MATPSPTVILPDPAATPAGAETDVKEAKKGMSEEEISKLMKFIKVRLGKFFDSYTTFLRILKSAHSLKIRAEATAQDELVRSNYISSVYNTFNSLYKEENDPSFKELMNKLRETDKENIYPHIRIPRKLNISLYKETGWSTAPFKEVSDSKPKLPALKDIDECLEEDYLIFQFNRNYSGMMLLFGFKVNGMSDQSFTTVMKADKPNLLTRNWTPPKDFTDKSSTLSKTEEKESIGEKPITELFNDARKVSDFENVILSLKGLLDQKIINQDMVDKLIDNRIAIVNGASFSDKDKIIEMLTLAKTNIASPTLRNDLTEIINRPKAGDLSAGAEPVEEEKAIPEPVEEEEAIPEPVGTEPVGAVPEEEKTVKSFEREKGEILEIIANFLSGVESENRDIDIFNKGITDEKLSEEQKKIMLDNSVDEASDIIKKVNEFLSLDLVKKYLYDISVGEITLFQLLDGYLLLLTNLEKRKELGPLIPIPIDDDWKKAIKQRQRLLFRGEFSGTVKPEVKATPEPAPVVEAFDIQPIMMPLPSRGETILVKKETEDELKALTDEEIDRLYADYFGDVKEDLSKDEKVFALINRNNELPRLNVPNFSSLKLSEWTLDSLRKYLKTLAELPEDEARMMTLYDKEGMYGFTPDNPFKYETSDAFGFNDEQFVKLGTTEKLPKRNEMMKQKDFDMTPEEWAEKNIASKLKSKQKVEEGFQAINRKLGKVSKMATKAYLELDPDIANHEVYQSSGFADDFNESWDASWSADTWSRVGYIQDKAHWEIPTISKSASEDIVSVMANEMTGGSLNYEYVSRGEVPSWYDLP